MQHWLIYTSGVNLRGEFNVENVVKYDTEEELKDDPRLTG
jgi:hypothetical protein